MRQATALLLALSGQLLLGWAIYAAAGSVTSWASRQRGRTNRRLLLAWVGARRRLLGAMPVGLALLLSAWALQWAADRSFTLPAVPVWFLVAGALPSASVYVILDAAVLESRGKLRQARRQARLAGQLMFFGILPFLLLVGVAPWFLEPPRSVTPEELPVRAFALATRMAVGLISTGGAAVVALLAGLAGKPRPSAWFVALLYLAGVAVLFFVIVATWGSEAAATGVSVRGWPGIA
jgi:hypothetical protein